METIKSFFKASVKLAAFILAGHIIGSVSGCAGIATSPEEVYATQCAAMGYKPGTALYLDCFSVKQAATANYQQTVLGVIGRAQTMNGQRIRIRGY